MVRDEQPQAIDQRRVLIIIGALLLGMLLAALDQTIVATALPTIAVDLHGLSHLSWVVTAYLLASTVSTPLWGKLGDMYGRKRFFQASLVIFLVGSALSGLSHSMVELIAFRAVQGLGGGGLILAVVCAVGFVMAERQAAEPVIPPRLFANRVFTSASVVGFAVGFAMFGALAYLPQYMQVVRGISPTQSGLRLLPLLAGLLLTS